MFDPLGDVYSCWEDIGDLAKRVATYGPDGLTFVGDTGRDWLNRFPGAIEQCSSCPYALVHRAGCGKHAHTQSGTIFASACEEFQTYFPTTLLVGFQQIERKLSADGNSRRA
jgi:uncharacterized protein